jgi:hypothetical protein
MTQPPWQPLQYDPSAHQQRITNGQQDLVYEYGQQQYPVQGYGNGAVEPAAPYQPASLPGIQVQRQPAGKRYALHGEEPSWYVLGCIAFGAAYFSKIPAKKAACEVLSELQLDGQGPSHGYSLRGTETFWYVMMCIAFGGGYFAKVSAKKALWEVVGLVQSMPGDDAAAIGRALFGPSAS